MKLNNIKRVAVCMALAVSLIGSVVAHADLPGRHPAYLHALSDLRAARWLIERRPGDPVVTEYESLATQQIDGAINDIKQAAIDDGKDIHDHPVLVAPPERVGRLHQALDILRQVHHDVNQEEDDPYVRGLKHDALAHVDGAIHNLEASIYAVESHR